MSESYNLNNANQYNDRVNATMTKMARFVPAIAIFYGILVNFHIIPGSNLYTWQGFVVLLAILVVTGLTQSDKPGQSAIQQLNFYLIFLSFSVFIIGLQSVLIYWAPLSITTALNFGTKGYWLTSLLLLFFGLLDSAIQFPVRGFDYLLSNLALVFLVAVAGGVIVAIISALMTDQGTLIRLKQKESLQYSRMQAIINSISDAIFSTDNRGVIKIYNAAALSLVDTNKALSGQMLDDALNLYDVKSKKVQLFDFMREQNKTIIREDLSHYFESNESIRLGITGAPIYTSFRSTRRDQKGYIFIIRDITKSKSLEEERDEFISVISHELRTPITITEASISNMQLVAQRDNADSIIMKGLGEAHDQVVYLAKMINDLSSLSRAEQNTLALQETVNVSELMQGMYKEYVPQAKDARLLMNLDATGALGSVTTNRLYLEEVLQNLITNAIKYTNSGSITLHASRTENGVLFAVKDTGNGIAKNEKEKVFQKFYRSEDYRTRETSGTGLGLYVSQKLAGKLGTIIKLDSRLHHGSTFSFIIKDKIV